MRKLSFYFIAVLVAAFLFTNTAKSQKITLKSGDLKFLKEVTQINVEYDYSDMGVGKFKNEEDYIEKKVADYNEDEPGRGDTWRENWYADREHTYQRKFKELVNSQFAKRGVSIKIGDYEDAEYTLILHTTFTEPGFNVGVMRKDALINANAIFIETGKPENELAVVEIKKSPGRVAMGNDYDTELRIGEAYAKAGKELAYFIWKKYLK